MTCKLIKNHVLVSFTAFFLAACGSDSGTDSGIAQAETVYGLGECEESNEGVVKLVTSDSTYYKCENGEWEETEAPPSSSSASPWGNNGGKTNFTPGNTFRDSRDGQTYRTVKIGDQVWMAENLNYAYTGVPFDCNGYTSDSTSWCYDNDPANCETYGRLYTWAAAMDSVGEWSTNGKGCGYYGKECSPTYPVRGVCPRGWHLPSDDEWDALFTAVGSSTAGSKLKSATGWSSSGNGTDTFGFSALPAGGRDDYGDYYDEGSYAYYMNLNYGGGSAYLYYRDKYDGFSVRCLKD